MEDRWGQTVGGPFLVSLQVAVILFCDIITVQRGDKRASINNQWNISPSSCSIQFRLSVRCPDRVPEICGDGRSIVHTDTRQPRNLSAQLLSEQEAVPSYAAESRREWSRAAARRLERSDFSISLELGLPLPCHWCHILPTRLSFDLFDDQFCNIVLLHPVFVSRADEPAGSLIRSWSATLCIHGEG